MTEKDSFPMPDVTNVLSRLAGSRVFSSIDMAGAFHCISLTEESRPYTAFSAPDGLYQFTKLVRSKAKFKSLAGKSEGKDRKMTNLNSNLKLQVEVTFKSWLSRASVYAMDQQLTAAWSRPCSGASP